jgi:hypothetical protein
MSKLARNALICILFLLPLSGAASEVATSNAVKSLDGQVQEIKADVLSIASDLDNLEERLLYPTHTQVAVFVELEGNDAFRLDAVHLTIDGELATHHIYSFKELDALRKGGVQRLFTGNVPTGDHELSIRMVGKLKNGKDFEESNSFRFSKGVEPKAIGITLAGPGLGSSGIQVGDW